MSKNTKSILEEALLEAKTIKDIALQSAKQKIYESQDSYLRNNLAEKLEQMNEEDSFDEEIDLNELLSEIEAEDDEFPTEAPTDVAPEGEEMSDMTDGDADKAISDMSGEELIALIRDAVSQELASQDGEGVGDEYSTDVAPEGEGIDTGGMEDEDEIDLDELLNEVDAQINPTPVVQAPVQTQVTQGNFNQLRSENQTLKTQLAEARKAINVYKKAINESKLFGAKSNALSKIFAKSNLSENQKRKIADKFDSCKTEGEVTIAYNVLKENLKAPVVKAKPSASQIIGSTKTVLKESNSGIISESLKARMQELAGIKKTI
jgi:hypothetical protein